MRTTSIFALAVAGVLTLGTLAAQPGQPLGRLPKFFNRVIDGIQREKIYKIQSNYDKQLDALQAQMDDLKKKRDQEVFGVLNPEQKARIQELEKEALEAEKKQLSGETK